MTDLSPRRRWRRAGLATRLTAWYLASLSVLLAVLAVFVYLALSRALEQSALADLRGEAASVRTAILTARDGGATLPDAARAAVDGITASGVVVLVMDRDGRVLARTGEPRGRPAEPPREGVGALRGGAAEWAEIDGAAPLGRLAILIVPLVEPASPVPERSRPRESPAHAPGIEIIQLTSPLAAADATLRTALVVLVGGAALTLALAALVGLPLTRLGLRPLRLVASASRRLAAGDLSARVEVPASRDEVGELSQAFNDMAARLEAAFATQRAFVADASHELRTPLTALGGQLDILPRATRDDPREAERLTRAMRREVTRMTRLVEDLLALARLDAQGAHALTPRQMDLAAVARDVYEQARALPLARDKHLRLVADTAAPIHADATRLHQVLLNLTVNALQHAPLNGQVSLEVQQDAQSTRAIVRDNGPGISPEHAAHLFDRFYRADAARTRVEGGAGLGLAIARAIVEAHCGTLSATNRSSGGAEFTVTLRADSAAEPPRH